LLIGPRKGTGIYSIYPGMTELYIRWFLQCYVSVV